MRPLFLLTLLGIGMFACGEDRALGELPTGTNSGADAGNFRDSSVPFSDAEQQLVDLAPGTWLQIPQGFASVCDENGSWRSIMGCEGLFAWSGGEWDPVHRMFLLFGGGQGDYSGNEVYGFHVATQTWERLTTPSLGPYSQDPLADGNPVARSTYDSLVWLPDEQRLFAWGGGRAADGNSTKLTWLFDPAKKQWRNTEALNPAPVGYSSSSIYDPGRHRILGRVCGAGLYSYDIAQNRWDSLITFGSPPLWPRYAACTDVRSTYDSKRHLLWMIGGKTYFVFDTQTDTIVTDQWITTGGGTFTNASAVAGYPGEEITTGGGDLISANAPGVDYDPKADALVAWKGGAVYTLNIASKTWTQGATLGPVLTHPVGTFGRFRYLSAYNVFLLINDKNSVWFYKNTAGGP